MRVGIDGERGLCFGVDWQHPDWRPRFEASDEHLSCCAAKKRSEEFFHNADWAGFQTILFDAGLLTQATQHQPTQHQPTSRRSDGDGSEAEGDDLCVDVERTVGMLVLTAIHDIMKIAEFVPTVQEAHAPYRGFASGDRINDHDVALAYALDHFGDALPSYRALDTKMRRTLRVVQSKMRFNFGWLIQAEAPPGALFSCFARLLRAGTLTRADVAFYCLHWLSDFASAYPTPLHGAAALMYCCQGNLLDSLLSFFTVVDKLADRTETEVFEEYLEGVWERQRLHTPPPSGVGAIALMRLVAQVQSPVLANTIVWAFGQLRADDSAVLTREMALSGVAGGQGQQYTREPEAIQRRPAFLVYYSPKFLQCAIRADAIGTLQVLAEIYQQARALWPFRDESSEVTPEETPETCTVSLRIDELKDRAVEEIRKRNGWVLTKCNAQEGFVEQVLTQHQGNHDKLRWLDFNRHV